MHLFLDREDKKILDDEAEGILWISGQLSLNYSGGHVAQMSQTNQFKS